MLSNLKDISKAVDQIASERGLDPAKIIEAIEASLAAAYKKEYAQKGEIVKCTFNLKTGKLEFWQVKTVVDETTVRVVPEGEEVIEEGPVGEEGEAKLPRYNPDRHIFLEEAKKIDSKAKIGDELTFPLDVHEDFGRIASQTAKQVILQRLRESERDSILKEYKDKEGQITSGIIQRFEHGNVYVDLGRATGVMFANESVPGEHYRSGDRMRFLILAVQDDSRLPGIVLSRASQNFISKLFEMEVPELSEGAIEVKAIAREAGSRTKIAAASKADGVDAVGSLVGQRGTRVMAVNNELGQEKIDIIEWSEDPAKFISNSLSPAKVESVEILPRHEARVYIPEDQLSLAIGKGGQNVRLAAKLTGWKIDIRSASHPEEVQYEGAGSAAENPEEASVEEAESSEGAASEE
ncbi:MAG: transcription termination factor NusA [Patescibacteria group bacterium]|nr:transcription termination factor NusA [Patescibacteria group bacterium]